MNAVTFAMTFIVTFIVLGVALLLVVQALRHLFPAATFADRVMAVLLVVAAVQMYALAYRLGAP